MKKYNKNIPTLDGLVKVIKKGTRKKLTSEEIKLLKSAINYLKEY